MNTFILSVVCLCFSISASAQRGDTTRRYLDENLALTKKSDAVYAAISVKSDNHWLLFAVYPDTGTLLKAYFKDRNFKIKDGPLTLYHSKGVKAMEGVYSNNIKQGIWKYWYPTGQLRDSGMMKNNQLVNTWYSWFENGQIKAIGNYFPDDSIQADQIVRSLSTWPNAGILENDTAVLYPHGLWQHYHLNGQIKESGAYVHGLRDGIWNGWHDNGKLESKGMYKAGELTGEWEFFYENGQPSTKEVYKNNKVISLTCYDSSGNVTGDFCSILRPATPAIERFVSFESYMLDNIRWPALLSQTVMGDVVVEYTISKTGQLTLINFISSPHEMLSKEVERFLKSIPKWIPASSHNRPIEFKDTLRVPFYR